MASNIPACQNVQPATSNVTYFPDKYQPVGVVLDIPKASKEPSDLNLPVGLMAAFGKRYFAEIPRVDIYDYEIRRNITLIPPSGVVRCKGISGTDSIVIAVINPKFSAINDRLAQADNLTRLVNKVATICISVNDSKFNFRSDDTIPTTDEGLLTGEDLALNNKNCVSLKKLIEGRHEDLSIGSTEADAIKNMLNYREGELRANPMQLSETDIAENLNQYRNGLLRSAERDKESLITREVNLQRSRLENLGLPSSTIDLYKTKYEKVLRAKDNDDEKEQPKKPLSTLDKV